MKSLLSGRRLGRLASIAFPAVALVSFSPQVHAAEPMPASARRLSGARLYVGDSPARAQADAWRSSRPSDARLMSYIASQPVASWIGGWTGDVRGTVAAVTSSAAQQGTVPVFVAYNIPHRDCGSYSAGGAGDADSYGRWIRSFAAGINGHLSVVVLEPDALAQMDCLSPSARDSRLSMLHDAVGTLSSAGALVYLDAGNAHWIAADVMADRLRRAGVDLASGFSLNVSNFISTADNVAFGNDLSRRLGGKHYVIDTSRNGSGGSPDHAWCNPGGQSLGAAPTTNTGIANVDALLWIKRPGESDGTCNGGPAAGQWWADYALGLARHQASSNTN